MSGSYILRALIVWMVMIGAETLHGILRHLLLEPVVGDFRARQISVFTGSIIVLAMAFAFIRWLGVSSIPKLIVVGMLWLCLTITFELLLGHFALGYGWERLAADFNIIRGGLLSIGLFVLMLSPLIAGRLRGLI